MSPEHLRLECLRLAHERLGAQASMADLWREANRLLAYVQGFNDITVMPDGREVAGKAV